MPGKVPAPHSPTSLWLITVAGGMTVAVAIGHWWGVPFGIAAGWGARYAFCRIESPTARKSRLQIETDVPFGIDLMSAVLRAGAPVSSAAAVVGRHLAGPWGEQLTRVSGTLRAGVPPAEAWKRIADTPSGARIAAAAIRSAESGAALATALSRLADELRTEYATTRLAATQRVGVLIVLPLGLCFLPAFVLTGLIPVLIAQFTSINW